MMTKEYVVNYLRLNGISDALSTQALSAELMHIGWNQGDIADAVRTLRGDTPISEAGKVNKMLNSDAALSSDAVVSLLNIHVQHNPRSTRNTSGSSQKSDLAGDMSHAAVALAVALIVAGITFTAAMFFMKIGPFYG